MTHDLKCWPEPFAEILAGRKRHEVRRTDRGFMVGDLLRLREVVPGSPLDDAYTGREVTVRVLYLTPGGSWGLPSGLCVMSIEIVGSWETGG